MGREAILCGACGATLTIRQYMQGDSCCPACGAHFNPGCRSHYHLYFQMPQISELRLKKDAKRSLVSKKTNLTNRRTIHIEWGDCDPAQIVYFPRYFAYFDACTAGLFKKSACRSGRCSRPTALSEFRSSNLRASFEAPSRFSYRVVVELR